MALTDTIAAAPTPQRGLTLRDDLYSEEFQRRLGEAIPEGSGLTAARLTEMVLTEFRTNRDLQKCESHRESIKGALLVMGGSGLQPGPALQQAFLTTRNVKVRGETKRDDRWETQCELQIGYRGYLKLARNSGDVLDIVAKTVYAGDQFRYWHDDDGDHILHEPVDEEIRGEPVKFFAHCRFRSGGQVITVLSKGDVDKRMRMSTGWESEYSPWQTWYEQMACKSALRAQVPYWPTTAETATTLSMDEAIIRYRDGQIDVDRSHEPPPPPDPTEVLRRSFSEHLAGLPDAATRAAAGAFVIDHIGLPPSLDEAGLRQAIEIVNGWPDSATHWARPSAAAEGSQEAPEATGAPDTADEAPEGAGAPFGGASAPAEPEADSGEKASEAEVQAVQIELGRLGISDRGERLLRVNTLLGLDPPVITTKDLTSKQATDVTRMLKDQVKAAEAAAPKPMELGGEPVVVEGVDEEIVRKAFDDVMSAQPSIVRFGLAERKIAANDLTAAQKRRALIEAFARELAADPSATLLEQFPE